MKKPITTVVSTYRVRSSKDWQSMLLTNHPHYDAHSKRWIECYMADYQNWKDHKYLEEMIDTEINLFIRSNPNAKILESFYEVTYDSTGSVQSIILFFAEYENADVRWMPLDIDPNDVSSLDDIKKAMINFHLGGEFTLGTIGKFVKEALRYNNASVFFEDAVIDSFLSQGDNS